MPAAEAANYRFNPFDLTKVWPHEDYPPIEIGKLELNRNPENIFAEVEQSIFSPGATSCPASARPRTRCSRAASSRTATPTATASASTPTTCR